MKELGKRLCLEKLFIGRKFYESNIVIYIDGCLINYKLF